MILWILLPVIVVLAMAAGVQAQELREVPASEILEKIQAGEDVNYTNVRVTGEFDLSKIKLKTIPIERWQMDFERYGLEEELKIVESKVSIKDSIFENDVNFSNTLIKKSLNFQGTSFLGLADYIGADFSSDVDFESASFSYIAYFRYANFSGDADFSRANFNGRFYDFQFARFNKGVNFIDASFGGFFDTDIHFNDAVFYDITNFYNATFYGDIYFKRTEFFGQTSFGSVNFNGHAYFWETSFSGITYFWLANFYDVPEFRDVRFNDETFFKYTNFTDGVDFERTVFSDDVDFSHANFGSYASFENTKFNKVIFYNTNFTNISFNNADFEKIRVHWSDLKNSLIFNGAIYIQLIKNFREMEQFKDADDATYQYRRLSQANKEWSFSKLGDVFMWLSCGYGVKPWRTAAWAVAIVLIFTPFYFWRGGIKRLKEKNEDEKQDVSLCDAFYFSMTTFTTLGYGDLYPADRYRMVAVMIEGLVGWLILALFLVTLANVMIRP